MIVTIANQKGGVGKTTLVALIANYLSQRGVHPLVIDTDHQRSLLYLRTTDLENFPAQEVPYEVVELDLSDLDEVKKYLDEMKNEQGVVIFDAPGNLTEDGLLHLLSSSDIIIIPFQYERKCLDSTGAFISVYSQIAQYKGQSARLLFVPNKIKTGEGLKAEREHWAKVDEALANHGILLPQVKELSCMKRINTLQLTRDQEQGCLPFLEAIYNELCLTL